MSDLVPGRLFQWIDTRLQASVLHTCAGANQAIVCAFIAKGQKGNHNLCLAYPDDS